MSPVFLELAESYSANTPSEQLRDCCLGFSDMARQAALCNLFSWLGRKQRLGQHLALAKADAAWYTCLQAMISSDLRLREYFKVSDVGIDFIRSVLTDERDRIHEFAATRFPGTVTEMHKRDPDQSP